MTPVRPGARWSGRRCSGCSRISRRGLVDQIVVYKIDRLTRSLSDFAKIVDRLDAAGASFVSVTRSFNTATSMRRLTLNMLLSFAQFEREVTAERIRDKIAASKKKGLWMGGTEPFGYKPDGRSLTIHETEAPIIRHIHDLYLQHGSVRAVAEEAEGLGYRTRARPSASGSRNGGTPFSRGLVYQILTNPLYAGRIRHHDKVYPGQHPAILDPAVWDALQERLAAKAARNRGRSNAAERSPVVGKLFDETGDRLTPSHSRKSGKRLRYYISRRLVTDRRERHSDVWRLPARDLETGIARILRDHLMKPTVLTDLIRDVSAAEIPGLQEKMRHLANDCDPEGSVDLWAPLLRRAHLQQGSILLRLDRKVLAERLGIAADRIDSAARRITASFQMQRRGVEALIILGAAVPRVDPVLAKSILIAQRWYAAVKAGDSFGALATREKATTSRIQQMIGLAFLAPDVPDQVATGNQPVAFTSEWVKRHQLPADWDQQRQIVGGL
ncbi:recombinase family protein [Paracoccus spongiarum]|uniref:Recombinase family protein n=1 Tax=Paracoccus spongiarum TaxID=3064387 RepID=A0ABT9J812_9RHOB|nr:recombinase family protein [Paracoccus sp. 2205BS29-5]MDP5305775.1 recombinase family protein [Paracoccus sp. 2205BS29-5]